MNDNEKFKLDQAEAAGIDREAAREALHEYDQQREYRVTWDIEVSANSTQEAAREALRIQRDPASFATVFTVYLNEKGAEPERVDLEDLLNEENENY